MLPEVRARYVPKLLKGLPKIGTYVVTAKGRGRVIELLALKESVLVDLGDGRRIVVKASDLRLEGEPGPKGAADAEDIGLDIPDDDVPEDDEAFAEEDGTLRPGGHVVHGGVFEGSVGPGKGEARHRRLERPEPQPLRRRRPRQRLGLPRGRTERWALPRERMPRQHAGVETGRRAQRRQTASPAPASERSETRWRPRMSPLRAT